MNIIKIDIKNQRRNELLKRNEIIFEVSQKKGTPTRNEIKNKISNILNLDIEKVIIIKSKTKTGSLKTIVNAHIYDSVEQLKYVEAKHIINRNKPKIETKEGRKE